ncbi:hypothetical protein DL771_001670 [Monosporascus sp. 5C6A]|nr:hypothetical protein DL771_001670 [Monosporascus sp. 5C6A]
MPAQSRDTSQVLAMFRSRLATDKRDKVFALLGLVDSSLTQLSKSADYSLNWRQVYQRTTAKLINMTVSLMPLVRGREFDKDPILPSWAPVWRATTDPEVLDVDMSRLFAYDLYNSSLGTELTLGTSAESDLKLKGVMLDEIETLGNPMTSTEELKDVASQLLLLLEGVISLQKHYPYGGTYANAFSRSVASDVRIGDGESAARSGYRRLRDPDYQAHATEGGPRCYEPLGGSSKRGPHCRD